MKHTADLISRIGAVLSTVILLSVPALAQAQTESTTTTTTTTTTTKEATQLDTVEVTGSRIKRTDYETASPVQIINRQEIEKTGRATIADVIRSVSADNQGSIPTAFARGFASGASAVSLRGLGVNSTLVLVNGRRMAPYGLADDGVHIFTDLNSIPLDAVERVEILKDGASAIYGSDAIGGVVNVILRKDYQGGDLGARFGVSEHEDGDLANYHGTFGFGNINTQGFNGFITAEATARQIIRNSERDDYLGTTDTRRFGWYDNRNGSSGLSGTGANPRASRNSPYGIVVLGATGPGGSTGVNLTSCPAAIKDPVNGFCETDLARFSIIQPKEDHKNIFGRGTFALGPTKFYTELGYFTTEVFAPGTPSSFTFGGTYNPTTAVPSIYPTRRPTLPSTHPDNPTNTTGANYATTCGSTPAFAASAGCINRPLALRYLSLDAGGRDVRDKNKVTRILVGNQGDLPLGNSDWSYDVGVLYNKGELEQTRYNFPQFTPLQAALNNVATPFRVNNRGANIQAMYDAIFPVLSRTSHTELDLVDGHVSGSIVDLPGGPLGLAVGLEYRKEKNDSPPTPGTDTGEVAGLGYSAYKATRSLYAAYAELNAPIVSMVEVNVAGRYDHYSDYGSSATPKVGLKFTPIPQLSLRGTYAKAFRAPNAAETGGSSFGFTNIALLTIANPKLNPETADSYTLGLVAEPAPDTSISVDYYQIKRKNEIVQANQAAILANNPPACAALGSTTPGATPRSTIYYNSAEDGSCGTGTGMTGIQAVSDFYSNANKTKTSGLDVDLRHRVATEAGKVTVGAVWTHTFTLKRVLDDGTSFDYAGTHGPFELSSAGGTPRDRATVNMGLEHGALSTSLAVNWVGPIALVDHQGETLGDAGGGRMTTSTGEGVYQVAAGQPVCGVYKPDGSALYGDCRLPSFTTVDLFGKFTVSKAWAWTASVSNVFDKMAPFDPYTYGGLNYHPASHQDGAVGRFYTIGAAVSF